MMQYIAIILTLVNLCIALPLYQVDGELYGAGTKVTSTLCAYTKNSNVKDGPDPRPKERSAPFVYTYKFYDGPQDKFPDRKNWISFESMFELNKPLMMQSCVWNKWGEANTAADLEMMKKYIQKVALDSLVDHRAILAVILQESNGCLHATTTNNGVQNAGIMQSHNGAEFVEGSEISVEQMIRDGTQGTMYGDGLVQLLNKYNNYYAAFRAYNSGSIAASGNLGDPNGATACYVSDVANRLLGWTLEKSNCPMKAK